jgi:glutamyl-Q tRNA(Asp) synthetase
MPADSTLDHRSVGRFAPSPTGALHIGSLVAAVGSFLMARRTGGRWLLRIDDLDTQRQVPGMADDIMRTLESCGLYWDGDVSYQSRHLRAYQQAFAALQNINLVYPCGCTRKDIAMSASAPHADDDGIPYPGTCREGMRVGSVVRSWRIRVADDEISFSDVRKGTVCHKLAATTGDFVLRRGDGEFAYQLAVVVDDYLTGVNQVVRGDDLLTSTPRQIYLQGLLGFPRPEYCHLPLVTAPDGSKLSKRDHLISCRPDRAPVRMQMLLLDVLRFLGMVPPSALAECVCETILEWGVANFDPLMLPVSGGAVSAFIHPEIV